MTPERKEQLHRHMVRLVGAIADLKAEKSAIASGMNTAIREMQERLENIGAAIKKNDVTLLSEADQFSVFDSEN